MPGTIWQWAVSSHGREGTDVQNWWKRDLLRRFLWNCRETSTGNIPSIHFNCIILSTYPIPILPWQQSLELKSLFAGCWRRMDEILLVFKNACGSDYLEWYR